MGPGAGEHSDAWRRRWEDRFEHQVAMGHLIGAPGRRRARLWVPVIVSFFLQVPATFFIWRWSEGTDFWDGRFLLNLAIALVGPIALIAARRFPGPVVAIVAAAASADLLLTNHTGGPPYIALAFAIVSAIVRGARIWAWISIGVAWAATLTVAGIMGLSWEPFRVTATTLGILIFVGISEGIRTRKERFEEMGRTMAQRKQSEVQAERVRIARELHDVLAHSLSQINVQASVGLHLMDRQPEKAKEALASIKETSKTALDEVRSVLGVLRAEDGADPSAPLVPEPDLTRLPGLAASVTSQGVAVTLENTLATTPTAAIQLAIYRIVQESLTNVLRHSKASAATVILAEDSGFYRVAVRDNGHGDVSHGGSGGRGVLGMRERAELLGGELTASSSAAGGFSVVASIPVPQKVDIS